MNDVTNYLSIDKYTDKLSRRLKKGHIQISFVEIHMLKQDTLNTSTCSKQTKHVQRVRYGKDEYLSTNLNAIICNNNADHVANIASCCGACTKRRT